MNRTNRTRELHLEKELRELRSKHRKLKKAFSKACNNIKTSCRICPVKHDGITGTPPGSECIGVNCLEEIKKHYLKH